MKITGEPIDQDAMLIEWTYEAFRVSASSRDFLVVVPATRNVVRVQLSTSGTQTPVQSLGRINEYVMLTAGGDAEHVLIAQNNVAIVVDTAIRSPVALPIDSTFGNVTDVAAGPGQYLLTGYEGKALRIGTNGVALDTAAIAYAGIVSQGSNPVSAVFDGTNYFIAWRRVGVVYGARIAPDGTPLDPDDTFNSLPGSKVLCSSCNGNYVEAYRDDQGVVVAYPTLDSTPLLQALRVNPATMAASAMSTLHTGAVSMVYGATGGFLFAPSLGAQELIPPTSFALPSKGQLRNLGYEGSSQSYPAAASNGTDFLVSWVEADVSTQTAGNVKAARVDGATGQALDVQPMQLGSVASWTNTRVAAAWGNGSYVTAWTDGGVVRRRAVLADGTLGADLPGGIQGTTTGALEVGAACNTSKCLIAWRKGIRGLADAWAARVDPVTLAALDQPIQLTDYLGDAIGPLTVASDSDPAPSMRTFLVGWTSTDAILTKRIRSELGAPQPDIRHLQENEPNYGPRAATLTSAGTNFFLAFDFARDSGVWMAMVDSLSGNALSSATFVSGSAYGQSPTAVYDGASYLVTWDTQEVNPGMVKRHGVRVAPNFQVLDAPFLISDKVDGFSPVELYGYPTPVALASNGQQKSLIAYLTADTAELVPRVRSRLIVSQLGGPEPDAGAPDAAVDSGLSDAGLPDALDAGDAFAPDTSGGAGSGGAAPDAGGTGGNSDGQASSGGAAGNATTPDSGTGGSGASGGAPAGSSGSTSGSSPDTGIAGTSAETPGTAAAEDEGCACRVVSDVDASRRGKRGAALAMLVAAASHVLRRRRRLVAS